jgi:O-antigen/teichoic acid export membrane protein
MVDGVCTALILGGVQFVLAVLAGFVTTVLMRNGAMDHEAAVACNVFLVGYSLLWWLFGSCGGIFVGYFVASGHYVRMAWWALAMSIATTVVPVVAVTLGGGLLVAGLAYIAAVAVVNVSMYADFFRLLKRESFVWLKPNVVNGLKRFCVALSYVGLTACEMARQHGARLILAPLATTRAIATFSTIRTGANVALQGLGTVTGPLLPELMRFLNARDQSRMEAAFATIWLVVAALMAPGIVVLQLVMEPLFDYWTAHQLEFDGVLFTLFSGSVLFCALSQPAAAILRGNNVIGAQLLISVSAAAIVVGLMFMLVPQFGLRGAGIALLIAEFASSAAVVLAATRWLGQHGLCWPWKSFATVASTVIWALCTVAAISVAPSAKMPIAVVAIAINGFIVARYWSLLPALAKDRGRRLAYSLVQPFRAAS